MTARRLTPFAVALALAAAATLHPTPARADDEVTGEIGGLIGLGQIDADVVGGSEGADTSPIVGLRWASRFSREVNWFLDGTYGTYEVATSPDNSKVSEIRTGLERLFPIKNHDLSWFLSGAIGASDINYPSGISDVSRPMLSVGIGVTQTTPPGGRFRVELRGEQLLGSGGLNGANVTNTQLLLGYSWGLRGAGHAPAPDVDSDHDGVPDRLDACPGTPQGVAVDSRGCPLPEKKAMFEPGKKTLILEGVNFNLDSAELTPDSYAILDHVASQLKDWSEVKVEVGGHTDYTGEDAYNKDLSQRRADAVRNYLVTKGIAADRMTTRGYGETVPIADNNSTEGRAKNRRVELTRTDQ